MPRTKQEYKEILEGYRVLSRAIFRSEKMEGDEDKFSASAAVGCLIDALKVLEEPQTGAAVEAATEFLEEA